MKKYGLISKDIQTIINKQEKGKKYKEVVDKEVVDKEVVDKEVVDKKVVNKEVVDKEVDKKVVDKEVVDKEVVDKEVDKVVDKEGIDKVVDKEGIDKEEMNINDNWITFDLTLLEQIEKKESIEIKEQKESIEIKEEKAEEEKAEEEKAEEEKADKRLRSIICCILGHVDVGKTNLLNYIKETHIKSEAGGITQQIGATFFSKEKLELKIGKCLKKNFEIKVPGLIIIDTPGHDSFTNLRKRGTDICDLVILVVDLITGLEKQTVECINLLKNTKTPFVIVLNKLDNIYGWKSELEGSSCQNYKKQSKDVNSTFQSCVNKIIVQFAEQGLNAELYWKNKDVKTTISMIPTSAKTGEGIADLIMVVLNISQKFLNKKLVETEKVNAKVLEVKPIEGLGVTCDIMLINGVLRVGDKIVLTGFNGPIYTTIKTLTQKEQEYIQKNEVYGAQGIRITAKNLDNAMAGSSIYVINSDNDKIEAYKYIEEEFEKLKSCISKDSTGIYIQSSTLGSLEALIYFLKCNNIPVFNFGIGNLTKLDVIKASYINKISEYPCILAFDVKINEDAREEAKNLNMKIIESDTIYRLENMFNSYVEEIKAMKRLDAKEAVFPCELEILPNCIFNRKNPIVIGVKIINGSLKTGTPLSTDTIVLGKVSKIEYNHKEKQRALLGEEVAISIEPLENECPVFGRHFNAENKIYSLITRKSINCLKEFYHDDITQQDILLLKKLKNIFEID